MSATSTVIIGNLTADPELTFTSSGAAVVNFTVAASDRVMDKATGEWRDGDPTFMRCSIWRTYAENVAESLSKGTRVVVVGKLRSRSYETREGEKRTVIELEVEEVGPALRYATATVTRRNRGDANPNAFGVPGTGVDDPWATPAVAAARGSSEIPF
jgi:single-strand DNA-binding protein